MKYTLKTGSVILLRNAISFPGWATNIEDIYKGGKLLSVTIPELTLTDDVKLLMKNKDVELSADELVQCKKAIEFAIGKGAMPISAFMTNLIEVLDLVPKK